MKICVLYFEGCPNHVPTVERVRSLVAEQGLNAKIDELEVTSQGDVTRMRFLGSPTVQVDGLDIEPAARARTDYAMSCRVYYTPDGLPSTEMLRQALGIDQAGRREAATIAGSPKVLDSSCSSNSVRSATVDHRKRRLAKVATVGSVASAVLSSACCWLPLLLIAFGASAVGVAGFFEQWRWPLVGAAGILLAIGFYLTYRTASATGADCCAPRSKSRRAQRTSLWVASIVVTAIVLFPNYVGALIGSAGSADVTSGARVTLTVPIGGLTCEGCAATLEKQLYDLPEVVAAKVDYPNRTATVAVDEDNATTRNRIVASIREAGFEPGELDVHLRDGTP